MNGDEHQYLKKQGRFWMVQRDKSGRSWVDDLASTVEDDQFDSFEQPTLTQWNVSENFLRGDTVYSNTVSHIRKWHQDNTISILIHVIWCWWQKHGSRIVVDRSKRSWLVDVGDQKLWPKTTKLVNPQHYHKHISSLISVTYRCSNYDQSHHFCGINIVLSIIRFFDCKCDEMPYFDMSLKLFVKTLLS